MALDEADSTLIRQGHEILVKGLGAVEARRFLEACAHDPGGVLSLFRPDSELTADMPSRPKAFVPLPPSLTTPGRIDMNRATNRYLHTGFELVVHVPDAPPWSIPLNLERVTLGSKGLRRNDLELNYPAIDNRQAYLEYKNEHFTITNENLNTPIQVNGKPVATCVLADEDSIVLGSAWLQIFKVLEISSELQVISGPDTGRRWKLNRSLLHIGRRGMRYNDIDLSDPTVSRTQCTLKFDRYTYAIAPESTKSLTKVNGETVEATRLLEDLDYLEMGETMLQYRIDPTRGKRSLKPQTVTILFTDLRGYSSLAESNPLKQMIDQLNEYLQAMARVIHMHGGTLLSYQGDAIMAVFGAPSTHSDDPDRAVISSLKMLQQLEELNKKWALEGRPPFKSGIGINTGVVMVGDIGVSEHMEYAAMGDDTNIAARLEELTRHYDADIILSERTHEKLTKTFRCEPLGEVKVRNREHALTIYKVVGMTPGFLDQTQSLS